MNGDEKRPLCKGAKAMSDGDAHDPNRVVLRKYPNRRYYDTTRSQYVTLEEIYELIRGGQDVQVVDSKSGDDITAKVLAQIILEHDPPKLGVFPVELLHQLIRSNEPLMRDFIDKYFNQALKAFLSSQRQFEWFLRETLGLQRSLALGMDWTRVFWGPLATDLFSSSAKETDPADEADVRRSVQELRREVYQLRQQLGQAELGPQNGPRE
jgi:polyhydroxyalkanoate synthesis repressor PhaR